MFFGGLFMFFDDFFMVYMFFDDIFMLFEGAFDGWKAPLSCVCVTCLPLFGLGWLFVWLSTRKSQQSHPEMNKTFGKSRQIHRLQSGEGSSFLFQSSIWPSLVLKGQKPVRLVFFSSKSVAYTTHFCMSNFSIRISVPQTFITTRIEMSAINDWDLTCVT